jgi:YD repeat-containing protein
VNFWHINRMHLHRISYLRLPNNNQMKIITGLLISLTTIAFLSSCQKEITADITTTPTTTSRIKTYTEDVSISGAHNVVTFNLTYDANGRIATMISASNPGDKFLYQYNSNTSYTMDLYNSNVLSIHENFFINGFSLIDSTLQYNDTKDTMTEKYIYNAAKQLTQLRQYDYTTATGAVLWETYFYTYDANGNITKETDSYSVTSYDYYTNLVNNFSMGFVYMSTTKNLVKTTTYTSGGSTDVFDHTYTFDSQNRLTSEKITESGGTDSVTRTYTYY